MSDPDHGRWSFAVDVFDPGRRRATVRRGGFTSREEAQAALRRFLEGEGAGFRADPNETVAEYLRSRLAAKELSLKPTTYARYRAYVHAGLIPHLGGVRLDDLCYGHIAGFAHAQLALGRGESHVAPVSGYALQRFGRGGAPAPADPQSGAADGHSPAGVG
ncbi:MULTISPECIES: hypothetical protein [unclassified Streptomyces]|uniref:hypothetical protein n=1 Tax=unclassified Streptomyces TaxID=2593676 RepID=UPI002DDB3D46|nr:MULTISPECIES: hypothetical protein [unclassified Streptomyces]WSA90523.1 hypothetical protein OIE63_02445 [Streptomyces sp. NBC_01795]WSB74848.1 hypothetical protein OHB04_02955 [Streptomyces sp. NBC_01775]WSS45612.1 hypothetical protein OG220_37210 [Streptomyces sp. NBC_01187]